MVRIVADLHTHSLACGHGFSTVTEVIRAAADCKLEAVALTEHGPGYPGSVGYAYFNTYRDIPSEMFGISVLKGCEANLMNLAGELDFDENHLAQLDIVIASCHKEVTPIGTIEQNTAMYIGAIQNPYVDIIGHPDFPLYPIDVEAVVRAAAARGVALEINNSSPAARPDSEDMCAEIICNAKRLGAKLAVGSDAHYHLVVGNFDYAYEMLSKYGYPLEQVINSSMDKLLSHLKRNR
ncbi:PHP domain-containing protein [Pelosinus fermentans]|uniref:PHP domain protein n=1 Tax=Pelosinus fermentans JBW45 TaxID=1192197 RepID=I9NVZ9_9FIRM|nr:PHP domain-containing protein [Pelosinus fermentans]AJQ26779.1 PHP domain protein [Pelosinus fermentans JBW45]